MKKGTKVCLIIALVCFVLGVVLMAVSICIGGNPFAAIEEMGYNAMWETARLKENFDDTFSEQEFELADEISIKELNMIDVNIGIGAVVIKPVSGEACRVLVQDSRNSKSIRSSVKTSYAGGTLNIEDDRYGDEHVFWGLSLWRYRRNNIRSSVKVIIELPLRYAGSMDAHIKLGALKCYEMNAKQLDFLVDAGVMYGEDTQQAQTINLTISMGEMKFKDLQGTNADFEVDMGDLQIDTVKIDKIEAECEMGNLDIGSVWAEMLTASCNMGNINLERADVAELEAECEMGNINLQMEGKPEDYFITSSVEMGDLNIEDRNETQNRNASKTLRLECEMGDIDVTFTGIGMDMDNSI